MRVISLNTCDNPPANVDAQVCIVGAGAAGLYLAARLAATCGPIVLLEAGPANPVSPIDAGFDCEFSSSPYRGATEGRSFGLGGTTARWGGQLVAFPPGDAMHDDSALPGVWPHILRVGDRHQGTVAKALGAETCAEGETDNLPAGVVSAFHAAGLSPSRSCWLPFGKRNFSWLARADDRHTSAATVWCDAVATEWALDQGANEVCRIREVVAKSPSGRTLRVKAKCFVIAAGAIESTRILHEINEAGAHRVLPTEAALGHFLSDHLSSRVGEFDASARRQVIQLFGPHFSGRCMRTWRCVEATPDPLDRRYFAHIVFATEDPGFQLARSVLQGLQARRLPDLDVRSLSRGCLGAMRIAWYRWIRSRLHIADGSPCHIQIDMEQARHFSNSISLSRSRDRYGRALAAVNWSVRDEDTADIAHTRSRFLERWLKLGAGLQARDTAVDVESSEKPHDAYHPVGTCRIGTDRSAVADLDLQVYGTANLYVLSTAIFPSAGSANPTFNLLCFAEMLAGNLSNTTT